MKPLIGMMIAVLLVSCSSPSRFKANLSMVLPYSFELEDRKVLPEPYVAKFSKGKKQLLYVLATHVSEIEYPNVLGHPTIRTVDTLFNEYKPEIVMVEGVNTGANISPSDLVEPTRRCEEKKFLGCGETFYSIGRALASGADYVSGEPKDIDILAQVKKIGFTEEDLLGFYLVRQIPQMKRTKRFDSKTFENDSNQFLARYRKRLGITTPFGYPEFNRWYKASMKKPESFLDIANNDTGPHGGKDATYVQKIAHQVALIRDKQIVARLADILNKYEKVLVVYGGSHFIIQEPALKEMMGEPSFFRAVGNPGETTKDAS